MIPEEPTASQKARKLVAEFRREWFGIGTCTQTADRLRAEAAIARIYRQLAMSPPRFIWCDSPLTAQVALHLLGGRRASQRNMHRQFLPPSQRNELEGIGHDTLGVWMGDALQTSAKAKLHGSLLEACMREGLHIPGRNVLLTAALASLRDAWRRDAVPSPWRQMLSDSANDQTQWGSMRARELLGPALEMTLQGSVEALAIPYRNTSHWGQLEALWIEGFLFVREVLGVRYAPSLSERLDCWADMARSCMWWWPYRGICIVSERPSEIHMSDGARLHNDAGPAVRFRDGWSVWAVDGVVVDEQVVLQPETQSLRQMRSEQNAEVKRIRIERYGWDRYLADVGATVLDRRRNDIEATRETLMRTPEGERVLVCACPSTARVYALEVPRHVRTCESAQAWISGGLARRIINGA